MAQFSDRMVPEVVQVFWAAYGRVSSSPRRRQRWVPIVRRGCGGCAPRVGCARVAVGI